MAGENIKFLMVDFACWIVAEIAHAKAAKDARNTGGKGRGGGAILDVEFLILDCRKVTLLRPADGTSKGWRTTTLLTRFAEELRKAPEAGG